MSLGFAFKGPEGIVLAVDSRVTLMVQENPPILGAPPVLVPSTFDNAAKLLEVKNQKYVGAVTYGLGALGQKQPRTASSFLPEFERELEGLGKDGEGRAMRLSVADFAKRLGEFFMKQWMSCGMPQTVPPGQDMAFLIGGYDKGEAYGRVFEIFVPNRPAPNELLPGEFGAAWGGQRGITDRIIQGFDAQLPGMVQDILGVPPQHRNPALENELKAKLALHIPFPFLPLQDCVDLAIFFIKTTVTLQRWLVGVRGVGGMVEVATVTRIEGFSAIQQKKISGEKSQNEVRI